jgi:hypothetical protein
MYENENAIGCGEKEPGIVKRMTEKIIAVDFDGCLVTNKYPEIGEPIEKNIVALKRERAEGAWVILWTNRVGERLDQAVRFCHDYGILLDAINENLPMIIEAFGGDTRKIFADEYWDDRAVRMSEDVPKEKSGTLSWAEREVEIACKRERDGSETPEGEWDYGCACYESALKAFKSLCGDGHSGFSIGATKHILNRLIEHKPLTPVEDTEAAWISVSEHEPEFVSLQHKRVSSLFKRVYKDGTVKYHDVNMFYCIDIHDPENTWYSSLVQRIVDEMFPITLPYFPGAPIKVYCEKFLTDRKNGDFDTVGVFYAIKPDNEKVEINRFFKESETGWDEIDRTEYDVRREVR